MVLLRNGSVELLFCNPALFENLYYVGWARIERSVEALISQDYSSFLGAIGIHRKKVVSQKIG